MPVFIIFLCAALLSFVNVTYDLLREARNIETVTVAVKGLPPAALSGIHVYRISPKNDAFELTNLNGLWISDDAGYFKTLMIGMKNGLAGRIGSVEIGIGGKSFVFSGKEFKENFRIASNPGIPAAGIDYSVFRAPGNVAGHFPLIYKGNALAINWGGWADLFRLAVSEYFSYFYMIVFILLMFLIFYLYKIRGIENKKYLSAVELAILSATIAVSLIFMYYSLDGGLLHPETNTRLPHYLSKSKSILEKIFDIRMTDYGLFQARELSYLFDIFDCSFISFSFNNGFPHFMSVTYMLALIAAGIIHYLFCRKVLKNGFLTTLLTLLLLYTACCVFMSGNFYRTAKIGCAVSFYTLIVMIYANYIKDGRHAKWYMPAVIAILSLISCLFDKQGYFLCIGLVLLIVLFSLNDKNSNIFKACGLPVISALFIYLAWNYIISPAVTFRLFGYHANFSYQDVSIISAFEPVTVIKSIGLYLDTFRLFFGNIPAVLSIAASIFVMIIFYLVMKPGKITVLIIITAAALIVFMNSIMLARHSPLLWPDVRREFYWLPATFILLFLLTVLIEKIKEKYPAYKPFIQILLALLIIGNISMLKDNRSIIEEGHLESYFGDTHEILPILYRGYSVKTKTYDITGQVPVKSTNIISYTGITAIREPQPSAKDIIDENQALEFLLENRIKR